MGGDISRPSFRMCYLLRISQVILEVNTRNRELHREDRGEMIGVVVVPLDGSKLAEEVLPHARQIADHLRIPLHLLKVIPPDASADIRDEAYTYLLETGDELHHPFHMSVRLGNTADQIIALADEVDNPIIAMTTHGRGGLGRLLYGSVADQVVRESSVPVHLVRSGARSTTSDVPRSIMVPLDGSAHAESALPYAVELAGAFDADLWLVRVVASPLVIGGPLSAFALTEGYQRAVREAEAYLRTSLERLDGEGVRLHSRPLTGFVEDEVLKFGEKADVDLVVMATRGRTGMERLTLRDLAGHLLRQGNAPVMMVRTASVISMERPRLVAL